MKFYAFFAAVVLMILSGCGSPNPAPVSNGLTNPYYPGNYYPGNYYPGQNVLPNGVGRYQQPLYANSGVTFNGSQIQVALGSVNAGDQIVATGLNSLMLYKNCGNNWVSFNWGYNVFPIMSPVLAVNGNPIPNTYMGTIVAPAAGSLTLLATASANGGCVGNLSATWSLVNGYGGYSMSPIAYINRCYNMSNNAPVACP